MKWYWLIFLTSLYACREADKSSPVTVPVTRARVQYPGNQDSFKQLLKDNVSYLGDSLMHNPVTMHAYERRYIFSDTCRKLTYDKARLKGGFRKGKMLGDINGNGIKEQVFVIPPFSYCDDGYSYYFTDTILPRLYTDSYCASPDDLFILEDIDEDGTRELGLYYSSCSGRYKEIRVYSLQKDVWVEVGNAVFDVLSRDPTTVKFEKLVHKTGHKQFRICSFDNERTQWKQVIMP